MMTNYPMKLLVTSPMEMRLSAQQQATIWAMFLEGGTSHSANAATLPYIIRRCEQTHTPYFLEAVPGEGYYISPKRRSLSDRGIPTHTQLE